MQVFNVYFKIIQKNLPQMMIFFVVFLSLEVAFTKLPSPVQTSDFRETKSSIAVINDDANAPFAGALYEYLASSATIKEIDIDKASLQDALFFRDVEYVLRIPSGYSEAFLSGKPLQLQKTTVPDSTAGVQIDALISRYLTLAALYRDTMPALSTEQLARYVADDLSKEAAVTFDAGPSPVSSQSLMYYRYFAYSMSAILILGVGSIMMVFGQRDLRRRNYASCVHSVSINLQLVLGNLVFSVTVWALMILTGFFIYPAQISNASTLPLLLNSFAYMLVCLCISLLCGYLIKSKNAQSAVANVLSLGLCFISGIFVPQEMLGKTVLRIASFTPTYWYAYAVDELINGFTAKAGYAILIQLGFAAALLTVTLAISRYKSTENE